MVNWVIKLGGPGHSWSSTSLVEDLESALSLHCTNSGHGHSSCTEFDIERLGICIRPRGEKAEFKFKLIELTLQSEMHTAV